MRSVTRVPLVKTVTSRPLADRVEVELREVGPDQHLAAGEEHVQAARLGDLVDQRLEPASGSSRARTARSPTGSLT